MCEQRHGENSLRQKTTNDHLTSYVFLLCWILDMVCGLHNSNVQLLSQGQSSKERTVQHMTKCNNERSWKRALMFGMAIITHQYLIIAVYFCYANCCGVLERTHVFPDARATSRHSPWPARLLADGLIQMQNKNQEWIHTNPPHQKRNATIQNESVPILIYCYIRGMTSVWWRHHSSQSCIFHFEVIKKKIINERKLLALL